MDLKQLEYFVNVVDLGGFSRAGRVLGIAQPAISRQIRSLEVELRQNLLLRNGRGATPTEAGKRLLDAVPAILELVAEGHGFAVLSPRALHGGDAARRLYARAIVQPRLTSKLAIATSAQRPSTPIQQRAIELIEKLIGPALALPRPGQKA